MYCNIDSTLIIQIVWYKLIVRPSFFQKVAVDYSTEHHNVFWWLRKETCFIVICAECLSSSILCYTSQCYLEMDFTVRNRNFCISFNSLRSFDFSNFCFTLFLLLDANILNNLCAVLSLKILSPEPSPMFRVSRVAMWPHLS